MWTVQTVSDRARNKERTLKTTDMLKKVYTNRNTKNYSIKLVKPIEFKKQIDEDDLHPYLLGTLIGNGTLNRPDIGFSTADKETLEKIEMLLPKTDKINHRFECKYNYYITKKRKDNINKTHTANKLIEYLLYNHKAIDKFIPKKYLYSSIADRIELLRGLMDTDGCCNKKQNIYKTVSPQLAYDVAELVRGLGGKAFIRKEKKQKESWNDCYSISIEQLDFNPFSLKRKKDRYIEMQCNKTRKRNKKYIVSIEKIPDEECQCIFVNHPDHLFVTDGYNLTHNTAIGTMFFMWCMLRHSDRSCFFVSHTRRDGKKSI
jgi:hypothetical protein